MAAANESQVHVVVDSMTHEGPLYTILRSFAMRHKKKLTFFLNQESLLEAACEWEVQSNCCKVKENEESVGWNAIVTHKNENWRPFRCVEATTFITSTAQYPTTREQEVEEPSERILCRPAEGGLNKHAQYSTKYNLSTTIRVLKWEGIAISKLSRLPFLFRSGNVYLTD